MPPKKKTGLVEHAAFPSNKEGSSSSSEVEDRNPLQPGATITNLHGRNVCRVGEVLGRGKFGKVFAVEQLFTSDVTGSNSVSGRNATGGGRGGGGGCSVTYDLAIKTIVLPKNDRDKEQKSIANTLYSEYTYLRGHLASFPWRGRMPDDCYGKDSINNVVWLMMERFEMDLLQYATTNQMTPAVLGHIGSELLSGLKWMHDKSLVYVDLKPQNIMIKEGKFYFVDFGCVESIRTFNFGSLPPEVQKPREQAVGTPLYNSLRTLQKNSPGKRDDVEALMHVLLSLTSDEPGALPWSNAKSTDDLAHVMERCDLRPGAAAKGVGELAEIVYYCRELTVDLTDYAHIFSLLEILKLRLHGKGISAIVTKDESSNKKGGKIRLTCAPKRELAFLAEKEEAGEVVEAIVLPKKTRDLRKRKTENIVNLVSSSDFEAQQQLSSDNNDDNNDGEIEEIILLSPKKKVAKISSNSTRNSVFIDLTSKKKK